MSFKQPELGLVEKTDFSYAAQAAKTLQPSDTARPAESGAYQSARFAATDLWGARRIQGLDKD